MRVVPSRRGLVSTFVLASLLGWGCAVGGWAAFHHFAAAAVDGRR